MPVDQTYYKKPEEDIGVYNQRIQDYNATKTQTPPATTPTPTPTTTPTPTIQTTTPPKTTYGDQLAKSQEDYQVTNKKFTDALEGIRNGSIPLNAGEQAQVDALNQQYSSLIEDQKEINDRDIRQQKLMGNRQGQSQYTPMMHLETIRTLTEEGAAKVGALAVEQAGQVAQLTQALKDNDIAQITTIYNAVQDANEKRQTTLKETIQGIQDEIKAANDAKIAADKVKYDTITKPIEDIQTTVLKNTGDSELARQVGEAGSVQDALALAGESMQVGTGTLGDYLSYKREISKRGGTPMNYDAFVKQQQDREINQAYSKAYAEAKGKKAGELDGMVGETSADDNLAVTSKGTGTLTKNDVVNKIAKMKLNHDQGNAVSYALRMMESNKEINDMIGEDAYNPTTAASVIGRLYQSDNARALDRHLQNFIRAQLRKESGAQINEGEFEGGRAIYSPIGGMKNEKDFQPTSDTRQQAIQSMIAQAGPAGGVLNEYFKSIGTGGSAGLSPAGAAIIEDEDTAQSKVELMYAGGAGERATDIENILNAQPDISYQDLLQVLGEDQ